jgi:WD40 repeat protein
VAAGAFTRDGHRLVTVGPEDGLRIHDLESGEVGEMIPGTSASGLVTVDLSPDGRMLVTGGGDGTVRFWELDPRRLQAVALPRLTIVEGRESVVAVAFSEDREGGEGVPVVLVATADGVTRRWPVTREDRYRLARKIVGPGPAPSEIQGDGPEVTTSGQVFAALLRSPANEPAAGEPRSEAVEVASNGKKPAALERR